MPKKIAPLSDVQISKAKSQNKDYKLSDGGGLYLLITETGGKLWRLQYRFDGKQKLQALGACKQNPGMVRQPRRTALESDGAGYIPLHR
jgi:hypothetical protein